MNLTQRHKDAFFPLIENLVDFAAGQTNDYMEHIVDTVGTYDFNFMEYLFSDTLDHIKYLEEIETEYNDEPLRHIKVETEADKVKLEWVVANFDKLDIRALDIISAALIERTK